MEGNLLNQRPNQTRGEGFVEMPPERPQPKGPPVMAKGYVRRVELDVQKPRPRVVVPVQNKSEFRNQTPGEGFVFRGPERPFYDTKLVMAPKVASVKLIQQAVTDAVNARLGEPPTIPATEPPKDALLVETAPRPLGMELDVPTWKYLPGKKCPTCRKRCLHQKEKMIECRNTGCTYRAREEALANK